MTHAGKATPEGTRRYRDRMVAAGIAEGHFREVDGLHLSSLGMGTYLGETDDAADARYTEALVAAVAGGCNVVDTAINYRHQRSERCIDAALTILAEKRIAARDEIFVATKGGYIPLDGEVPADVRGYFQETFLEPGIFTAAEVVGGMHCMTPRYLEDQIDRSLANMGLETIDLYYVHNPEGQLPEVGADAFRGRMRAAFELLERSVAEDRIAAYGTATWNGYRVEPGSDELLSLADLRGIAAEAGGGASSFRFIQLPHNLAMTEALVVGNQPAPGDRRVSTLTAALDAGMGVMASASLCQGKLAAGLPPELGETLTGLETDAQRALQFVRSTPGVTVALVGMSTVEHVQENLQVARVAPAPLAQFQRLFRRG